MAINIKFDKVGNPEPPTIILANKNGNKLGQLDANIESIDLVDRFNDASEFSFTLNKYKNIVDEDGKVKKIVTNLWDKVVDFKLVYCKEWDKWFEIKVELDEATETVKTVFCTQLGQAELSQLILYDIEINTEKDIERDDYKITILYDGEDHEASLLHRLLKDKAPHYSIIHVDSTIAKIQRTFSFDGKSIHDAFQEIAEEIGCLFIYHSDSNEDGGIRRGISVYDLQQNCNDCSHRGEFTDVCPECGSKDIEYGYGEDTLIFVTSDELAASGIQLVTDTDSVKNCFRLKAGDDLMTATIRNCNPNGTNYIWYLSDNMKEDMSDELVEKLDSYNEIYNQYYNEYVSNIDTNLLNKYNAVIDKYSIYNKDLQKIATPIVGYSDLMNAYYNAVDLSLYLKSGLMPSVEMSDTNAKEQALLLNASSLSPIAVADVTVASLSTINSAILAMAKVLVRSTYKVQINSSELVDSGNARYWRGNFAITNYSDEEDTAISNIISVSVNDDLETFIKQKIEKALNKENDDDLSISGLFKKEYNDFCNELKKYALNPLTSFYDACRTCIDILIEQGVGDGETWADTSSGSESNLYEKLYMPYYDKLMAIEAEMKTREDEIGIVSGTYDLDGNLIIDGLQSNIENYKNQIQNNLNFENYLGEELWLEFCAYRRDDEYSNDNYISDGLNNAELFKRALEFIEVAENEIYKSAELQHSISTTLNNLLAIPKFKPLVESFKVGNWIRVQVDDNIYKLRLLEYGIDYGNFEEISVEFSDITKIKNGITDVQNVIEQAKSMHTSYGYYQKQASNGDDAKETIDQLIENGLSPELIRIKSNDNEEVIFDKNGLLCRSYDDITGLYSPEQFRLTHNIMAYTSDAWATVSTALGKHDYVYYDSNKILQKGIDYGLSAKFVTAGIVNGSQIIGGDIYSNNYSSTDKTGSYLNLTDGTFDFAGGKLAYKNNKLSVNGEITATSGTIGGCSISDGVLKIGNTNIAEKLTSDSIDATNIKVSAVNVTGTLTASQIDATNLKVKAANIDGKLTASQINTSGLIAENISGTTITGKTISGGSINIGSGNFVVDSNGKVTAKSGTFSGSLSGVSGTFTKLEAGQSSFKENQIIINATYKKSDGTTVNKGSVIIGHSGYTDTGGVLWDDVTIMPSSDNIGNIGTPSRSWDMLCVKNGTVQSSDRNYKKDIAAMGEKQEDLFNLLSPVIFKFIDSTNDRYHYGYISQDVEDAIYKAGLTSKDFAGFCKDIKRDENGAPILDEDGNQKYVYSLRYSEFIALNTYMIQKIQAENNKLKERVDSLENTLNQLSGK